MKLYFLLLFGICIFICFASTAQAGDCCTQKSHGAPRIKFLDDLWNPFESSSEKDPYEERIETERHDFTQSTKTVGRGVIQIESGYSYFYKDNEEEIENSHTTPEMMCRFGLTEDIEFRLRWNYSWRFIEEEPDLASAEDLRWSIKLGLTDQDCFRPESALELRFTAPTGGSSWSTERVEFSWDYIYAWEIAEGWELYGSTGYLTNGLADFSLLPDLPAGDRFSVWSQSVAIGAEVTETSVFYLEYFGLHSYALENNFSVNFINVGIDYYVTNNLVVDIRIGKGLSPDSDDLFTGVGGGVRF